MTAIIEQWGQVWVGFVLPLILQNTAFLLILFGVLHLVRKAPAATRHGIALIGLVKLLVPFQIPRSILPLGGAPLEEAVRGGLLFTFGGPGEAIGQGAGTGSPPAAASLLAVAWLAVAGLVLVRTVQQNRRLVVVLRTAEPVVLPSDLAGVLDPGTSVLRSPAIGMPLTHGLLPARIYVPLMWDYWREDEQRAALLHEQAHLRRRDGLVQIAESVARILYFWHPLLHVLLRRLDESREMACDDETVGRDRISRLDYSRFLVGLAERSLGPTVECDSVSSLFKRKQELLNRVAYQVKEEGMNTLTKNRLGAALGILLLAAVPLSMDWGNARSDPPPPPKKEAVVKKMDGTVPSPPSKDGHVMVALKGDDIIVNGKKTTLSGFSSALAAGAIKNPQDAVVHFKCGPDVTMEQLFGVQSEMRKVGMTKVVYAGGAKGEVPLELPPADAKAKLKSLPESQVLDLRVAPGPRVTANGSKVGAKKVRGLIQDRLSAEPNMVVSLTMARDCTYKQLVSTLDQLRSAGAERIALNDPE